VIGLVCRCILLNCDADRSIGSAGSCDVGVFSGGPAAPARKPGPQRVASLSGPGVSPYAEVDAAGQRAVVGEDAGVRHLSIVGSSRE